MKNAITISDLHKYAEKLPKLQRDIDAPYRKVAMLPEMDIRYVDYADPYMRCPEIRTITFEARHTKLDGVQVTAWYYHDVLVKVAV